MMYKLFHNLYIGTSGKPSPTDIEDTFVLYFVGDGFLHVPKHFRYFNQSAENNLFQITRTIINSERSDPQLIIVNF